MHAPLVRFVIAADPFRSSVSRYYRQQSRPRREFVLFSRSWTHSGSTQQGPLHSRRPGNVRPGPPGRLELFSWEELGLVVLAGPRALARATFS